MINPDYASDATDRAEASLLDSGIHLIDRERQALTTFIKDLAGGDTAAVVNQLDLLDLAETIADLCVANGASRDETGEVAERILRSLCPAGPRPDPQSVARFRGDAEAAWEGR